MYKKIRSLENLGFGVHPLAIWQPIDWLLISMNSHSQSINKIDLADYLMLVKFNKYQQLFLPKLKFDLEASSSANGLSLHLSLSAPFSIDFIAVNRVANHKSIYLERS